MDRQRRRCLFGTVASFAFPIVFSSSAGAAADRPSVQGDGGTIRLLVNAAGTQSFLPFVIRRFGLEKKYGFTLETVPSTTQQTTITGLQMHAGDLGHFGWNDLARVKAAGVNIVGVVPFLDWANMVVVPADSSLRTLGDLRGKKVGVYGRTSLDWVVMRALAQKEYHLDLETDAIVQEGAISLLRGLMDQGQLDASLMFHDLAASMVVSGKYRVMARIKTYVDQLGLPDMPFTMYAVDMDYAAAHENNLRAFLAAYRETIDILKTDDTVWAEHGKDLNMTDPAVIAKLREFSRPMLLKEFAPDAEANIRKAWDILVATAGAEKLGMGRLPDDFMTLRYQ